MLDGLRTELRDPTAIREYVAHYQETRRALAQEADRDRGRRQARFGEVSRTIERLVDMLASGGASIASVRDRLISLETEKAELTATLAAVAPDVLPALHPGAVAHYLTHIDELADSVKTADNLTDAKVATALLQLVERVTVHPVDPRQPLDIEVTGRLAELIQERAILPRRRTGEGGGAG